jgi:hypothetical protein
MSGFRKKPTLQCHLPKRVYITGNQIQADDKRKRPALQSPIVAARNFGTKYF